MSIKLMIQRKKVVAIKILKEELSIDEDFVKKFKSEALACKDIKQENVISAYDVVDEGNMHYIVMEYLEGITLNKYIKQKVNFQMKRQLQFQYKLQREYRLHTIRE